MSISFHMAPLMIQEQCMLILVRYIFGVLENYLETIGMSLYFIEYYLMLDVRR